MERPLTERIRPGETVSIAEYRRAGGYSALEKALRTMSPEQVLREVTDAKLRGRGGAGFYAGVKWSFVPMGADAPRPKYLVANADEMEPGTFKDRYLIEGDPHQLLEGMILGAYAIGAEVAYVFLRWEYRRARDCLRTAIAEAEHAGLLGKNILGSGFDLSLHLHVSAGRYMCGEETGLLNALEGKRAIPRAKPPYPQVSGLFGKPTVINNVETLANVPHIVKHGAAWFTGLSRAKEDGGTKLFGVSGKVKRPGLWELPLGAPLGEVLERAGGMQAGLTWRGLLPGGASTAFLLPQHADLPLDFASVERANSRLGTGCLVVLDDRTCPVGMLFNLERFFARESCGFCTPCRDGLPWTAKVLDAIERGAGEMHDLDRLAHHCRFMRLGLTFCALAPGAVEPLKTGLEYFRDDFVAHVERRSCPYRHGAGA